jgi:hypothetical protein
MPAARFRVIALAVAPILSGTAPLTFPLHAQARPDARFEIVIPAALRSEALTGRAYVMISRTNDREPRFQIGRTGVPFYGHDFVQLRPGAPVAIDRRDLGHQVDSIDEIPAGDYYVQAMVNVYSEFRRADGHVLWMHDDQWEGQNWRTSPGNMYSAVQRVHLDPRQGYRVRLPMSGVNPPVVIPPDNEFVKRFKIQSPTLTKFWGRPIYLGATVLLPRDYATSTISYPVNYQQGHFSLAPPFRFEIGNEVHKQWTDERFPRVITVTLQHPTPYFDDSYVVNSPNSGPYDDAVMNELIPEVERRFRTIREPWARWLSGGSTGGWIALAMQLFHPEFFGGTWAFCPDPVTFTGGAINLYKDDNAFYKELGWYRQPTIYSREINGDVRETARQRSYLELVSGTNGRSGEQRDVFEASYGPIGSDGYFKPVYDKRTGVIDPDVVRYWKEHFDLLYYMQRNWPTLGPKLVDKLHVYVGDADTYFLDRAVREMDAWMKTTSNPHYEGFFVYGDGKPHCWSGPGSGLDRVRDMAEFGLRKKPDGVTTPWWTY